VGHEGTPTQDTETMLLSWLQASRSGCSSCTRASSSWRSSALPSWRSSSKTTPSDDRRRCLLLEAAGWRHSSATGSDSGFISSAACGLRILHQQLQTLVQCRYHAQADGFCTIWSARNELCGPAFGQAFLIQHRPQLRTPSFALPSSLVCLTLSTLAKRLLVLSAMVCQTVA